MTVQIHDYTTDADGDYLAELTVVTEDAASIERRYEMALRDDSAFNKPMVVGKRVGPDGNRTGSPSQTAWDAARQHFRERGHEVKE